MPSRTVPFSLICPKHRVCNYGLSNLFKSRAQLQCNHTHTLTHTPTHTQLCVCYFCSPLTTEQLCQEVDKQVGINKLKILSETAAERNKSQTPQGHGDRNTIRPQQQLNYIQLDCEDYKAPQRQSAFAIQRHFILSEQTPDGDI